MEGTAWGFLVGLVAAFVLFFMFIAEPAPLSPVGAYCRGAVDGRVSVIRAEQVYNPSPEELDEYEAQCAENPNAIHGRGPLVPDAPE